MNYQKRVSRILLVTILIVASLSFNVLGVSQTDIITNEDVSDQIMPNKPIVETIAKSAVEASNGTNLLKIRESDFELGELDGLIIDEDGNLTLEEGKKSGIFYSPTYVDLDFEYLVTSWNTYLPGQSTIEVEAIAFVATNPTLDPDVGEWSDYLTWGEWGPQIRSGSVSTRSADTTLAYMSVDEFTIRTPSSAPDQGATKIQFKVTLKQGENTDDLPLIRQVTTTWANNMRDIDRGYAEDRVAEKPQRIEAPAYSQNVRDPAIGGAICSPTTLSIMLNQRDPSLDLLPEEIGLAIQDFNYGFGNWSYTGSTPGLYGYEAYIQYGDFDIIRQELSKGHTVGMSVRYASYENGTYPYLKTGAANSTGGHLITLTGFYYDQDLEDYVYYSSDSATANDYISSGEHRRYQEEHLNNASRPSKHLIYIIPSTEPITDKISGVEKIDAEFEATGNENEYKLLADGQHIELDPEFISDKRNQLDRGTLAYTIQGIKSEMPEYVTKGLTANDTFFYRNIAVNESGNIVFDVNTAFRENNIPVGQEKEVTFFVMTTSGFSYQGSLRLERTDQIYVNSEDGYCDVIIDGNNINVYGELEKETSPIELIIDGKLVKEITPGKASYTVKSGSQSYKVDTRDIIVTSKHVKSEKGKSILFIEGDEFSAEESSLRNAIVEDGVLSVKADEIGYYYSPVYHVDSLRYIIASWEAITPGKSSVEIEVRAHRLSDQNSWTQWYSFGEWGTGIKSISKASSDPKGTMDVDVFSAGTAVDNIDKFQIRAKVKSDGANLPQLYSIAVSFRDESAPEAKAQISGSISNPENFKAYSAYSYFGKMAGWRFENMMLILLNNQGADLLFEEVALRGYDFNTGAGNWAFMPTKVRTFGHTGFVQYGTNTDLIKEYIDQGLAVGILANTRYLESTNSNVNRPIIVYNYDEETETFYLVCPSGDTSELNNKDVYFESSEDTLQKAIDNGGNSPGRWLMFVVGTNSNDKNNLNRTQGELNRLSETSYELLVEGNKISLPDNFTDNYNTELGGGVIMYSIESENPAEDHKLAERKFYYDISVEEGNLIISEDLQGKINTGENAQVFIVTNDGITYQALIEGEDNETGFTDISPNMWYYEAVKYVADNDIMKGTSESLFTPNGNLTREMAVTVLFRYAGQPDLSLTADFEDVEEEDYFYKPVSWATDAEIIRGYGDNIFGTGDNLTREDFALILYRYAKSLDMDVSETNDISVFEDSDQVSSYAIEALGWANSNGLILGKSDSNLAPKDSITRAEAATIIMRFNDL